MTTKKLFIIALILLVLVGGTLLVYNLFFTGTPTPTASPGAGLPSALPGGGGATISPSATATAGAAGGTGAAGQVSNLKIKPISKEKIMAPTIGEDGKTVKYYSRLNGQVWESAFDGSALKKISSTTLNSLIKVLWSPDKEKVIGVFSENDKIKKYFYNYANNQSALLNENIGYVAFSPDSKKIAYQFTDPSGGQSNISVSSPDGTNWKNIFKTRLDNLIVEWPSQDKISLRQPISGLAQGILYALNSQSGDFSKILSDLFGLNVKWSPKADKILYSSTDERGRHPQISLTDDKGANFKDLKMSGLVDKCVWSNDDRTVFCALPQDISANATWPDDYYKGLVILSDDFYKINLETNEKTKIAGSTEQAGYDAQELFLSPKGDYLFFVNRADGLLYSLKL
jgi:Tol biopolymer transport system component